MKLIIFSILSLASFSAAAITPYTLLLRQYDYTGFHQLAIPVEAPYESAYLWYNPTTNVPEWGIASSISMGSTQISDTSSVGRDLMTAANGASARSTIGAGTSSFSGAYGDLTGSPTNLNQFTNGPGFVTSSTAPVTSVNGFTGGVALTAESVGAAAASHAHAASQITDSTTIGRSILTAANQAAVQAIVGSTQVNSDWSSTSGLSQILNKPAKYTGSTNGSGVYSATYGAAYSTKPHLVFVVEGGTNKDTTLLTSTTTTGFSILIERRTDAIGLLPTYAAVSGITVNVMVTP